MKEIIENIDIRALLDILSSIPTFVYIVFGFFVLIIVSAKSVQWKYEADLVDVDSFEKKAEIEFKKYKKEQAFGEFEMKRSSLSEFSGKQIAIYLNDYKSFEFNLDSNAMPMQQIDYQSKTSKKSKKHNSENEFKFFLREGISVKNGDSITVIVGDNDLKIKGVLQGREYGKKSLK